LKAEATNINVRNCRISNLKLLNNFGVLIVVCLAAALVAVGSTTEDVSMNGKLLGYLSAGALATALALASPAFARGGGGGGGGGGGHGGGGMGGHGMGGGMGHSMGGGGGWGGGMRSMGAMSRPMGAMAMHPAGMGGPMRTAAIGPHWSGAGWHHAHFSHFPFHHRFHHRFNRFAFFAGAPYYDYAYYDDCWRRVWTGYGLRVVNVCSAYGY
jgi:hypothetical protein